MKIHHLCMLSLLASLSACDDGSKPDVRDSGSIWPAETTGDVDIDGLGFISIIEGTNSFFAFDVIFNDFPIEYKITVWDLDSADTVTGLIESGTGGSGPNNGTNPEIVYFSAFTGINFAMVGAIQLEFTGGNSADLSIDNFRTEGETAGAPVDLQDGYIHFSTAEQARETARKHFAGTDDLELVAVEADNLTALRWEPSRGGALFPHLYAHLRIEDVTWHRPLPLSDTGHVFPEGFA